MTISATGVIRRAKPDEARVLHALTGRSVLHWGYEPEFLDWEPEAIAVTPEFIEAASVFVLEHTNRLVGYYALTGTPDDLFLDKLFVDPSFIGTGCGKRLWLHAIDTARTVGATGITLYSDPHAAAFYRAMGAEWQREESTSRPGWALQVFRLRL
jgi:GNAT superfamily N-acetyltransferase